MNEMPDAKPGSTFLVRATLWLLRAATVKDYRVIIM